MPPHPTLLAPLLATLLTALPLATFSSEAKPQPQANASSGNSDIVVNGRAIKRDELRQLMQDRSTAGGSQQVAAVEAAAREHLIQRELLAQEARKAGLDNSTDVVTRIAMAREEILAREYQAHYLGKNPVSDADVRKAYDTLKQRAGDTEYRIRQIFVPTEDEARKIVARLDTRERFDTLATTLSKDESTRAQGGDSGWITPLNLQNQFIGAVAALKKGDYTRTPIKGQNGWHVLMLEDSRPFAFPAYEKLEPQIRRDLAKGKLDAHLQEMRKRAVVK